MPNAALIIRAQSIVAGLALVVDGYPHRTHKLNSRIGREPLEDGREVTDHVIAAPKNLVLNGSVSDLGGIQRPEAAWREIERLFEASEPVRVITEWGTYPEMVIQRCEGQPQGRGLDFELELSEIIRVSGAIGPSVPPSAQRGNAQRRTGQVSRGRVQTVPYGDPFATLI